MADAKIWSGTQWISLVGPEGPAGADGKDGTGVAIQGTATTWPPTATPSAGDMYLLGDPVPAGAPIGSQPGDGVVWTGTAWTNAGQIRGPKGDTGADGADGAPGVDGAKGDQGDAATVAVGTVTALSAGATPTVANSGTVNAAVLDFGIPAGAKGDTGADGADGADGDSIEVFVQASEPVPQRAGAIWIDNT